ncbi:MAG: hypothetical protein ACT4PV_13265 [Planctomycetaceae bacterium]
MSLQEWGAFAAGALAVVYLVHRFLRRSGTGNCCGEAECPAAAGVVKKLQRAGRTERAKNLETGRPAS